jgi:predicted amidohydrolase YtcJ
VVPGLVDAHVHLGQDLPPGVQLPFAPPRSAEDTVAAIRAAAATAAPGTWISALIGPPVARDRRHWRRALDEAAPHHPVYLRAFWGHTTLFNSAAMRRLQITDAIADPLGGWFDRDPDGRLDGRAHESAEEIVAQARAMDVPALAQDLKQASEQYLRWGVTSIHLMNSEKTVAQTLQALGRADTRIRWIVYRWATPIRSIDEAYSGLNEPAPPRVRVEGPKWVLDGTPIEQDAHQTAEYPGRPGWRGRSNYTDAQLREILQRALTHDRQVALHVVGAAETQRVLTMMEALAPPETWRARRVRIEHGDTLVGPLAARAARLGLAVIQNPPHFQLTQPPGTPALVGSALPMRSLIDAGLLTAIGSDAGGPELNPFLNIRTATTYASAPAEKLTREQALLAYTVAGWRVARDDAGGRLVPGSPADLALLSHDVLRVPDAELPRTTSLLTVVDGQVAFEDPRLQAGAAAAPLAEARP